ncbi:MAG TPA: FG-GAP-like repeat-containing protein [Thermoanaerobaculia bacterium]|nr:FG-GAP-like repeat-containing protein [Thermoanaerobaculia bacterium]
MLLQAPSVAGAHNSIGIAVADFNKDGMTDYAVPSSFDSSLTVYLGHGDGTFAAGVSYSSGGTNASRPVVADFNSDTYPDLAVLNYDTNSIGVLLNQQDGTFAAALGVAGVPLATGLEVGKFNGDGIPDLLVTGSLSVKVLYGAGNGTFPASETLSTPGVGYPVYATAGDLNHDGTDEVVLVYNPSAQSLRSLVVYSRGGSAFQTGTIVSSVPAEVDRVYAVDLNNDGAADVFTLDYLKRVLVFVNDGSGGLASPVTYTLQQQPSAAVVRDITEDGIPDLIFATINVSAGTPTMIGNGDGTFQSPVLRPIAGSSQMYGIGAGDITGDGHVDFLIADSDYNLVHVLETFCPNQTTTTSITSNRTSNLYKDYVVFTVTVTPDDGGNLTGRVLMFDGSRYIGPLPLSDTTPKSGMLVATLQPGDHVITARYEGTQEYVESSASIAHNVYRLPFGAPPIFAAAASTTTAYVSWIPTDDCEAFEVWRMGGGSWMLLATTSEESYKDTLVTAGESYFYRVRAIKTGSPTTFSAFTPSDAASVRPYVLPVVGFGIHHLQMEDARDAVNHVRFAAGLAAFPFSDPLLEGVTVKAVHMTELRSAISEALAVAGAPAPSFADITPEVTIVHAQDILDILSLVN